MKKALLFTIVICLIGKFSNSQEDISLRLFVTDNENRTDTIEFGLNNASTIDVDPAFGELDVFDQPWDSLDIRIIERDEEMHNCLHESHFGYEPWGTAIYYDQNRDYKTCYRPRTGAFGTVNMNFEIQIKTQSPPVQLRSDFAEIDMNDYEGYSAMHLLDSDCNTIDTYQVIYNEDSEIIWTLTDTLTTIVVEFQHEVGIEEQDLSFFTLHPNPVNDVLTISTDEPVYDVKIYDLSGKLMIHEKNAKLLDLHDLCVGVYVFSLTGEKGSSTQKLIIQ